MVHIKGKNYQRIKSWDTCGRFMEAMLRLWQLNSPVWCATLALSYKKMVNG